MTKQQAGILNLAISVLFATLMIVLSKLFDFEDSFTVIGLLTAVWFIPFSILSNWNGQNSIAKEINCLLNRFSRS